MYRQRYMQSIKYNKESHPILNQIYDILAEFQKQDKQIILCKSLCTRRKKEIKKQIKRQNKKYICQGWLQDYRKQTTTSPSKKLETPNSKWSVKKILANYTTPNHALKSGKVSTTAVSSIRLTLLRIIDQYWGKGKLA